MPAILPPRTPPINVPNTIAPNGIYAALGGIATSKLSPSCNVCASRKRGFALLLLPLALALALFGLVEGEAWLDMLVGRGRFLARRRVSFAPSRAPNAPNTVRGSKPSHERPRTFP